ncbi:MAG: hypothetical protein V4677_10400 [Bacteroidota bacterium]
MEKYGDLDKLRTEFGRNKEIPEKYEEEILIALSHYPDLKDEKIHFVLTSSAPVPYGTKPTAGSYFAPREQRIYTITILEWAKDPENEALMKNLDRKMRIGVFAHELGHVLQYKKQGPLALLRMVALMSMESYRRKLERGADKLAIEHGLGEELLRHAEYIRLIPDYVELRPEINKDYLLPEEIAYYITHYKLTHVT